MSLNPHGPAARPPARLTERALLAWVIGPAAILMALFLCDLLFIRETLLTPYEEFHQCSPAQPGADGVASCTDPQTGRVYARGPDGGIRLWDASRGTMKKPDAPGEEILPLRDGVLIRHAPVSPFYAFFMPVFSAKTAVLVLAAGLFIFLVFRVRSRGVGREWVALVFLTASAIIIRASFAWLRHGLGQMGAELLVYPGEDVIYDVPKVGAIPEFLKAYPGLMPSLSLHGSHFPPGYAVLLKLIALAAGHSGMQDIAGNIGVYGWSIIVLGSTAVIPLFLLTRELWGIGEAFMASAAFILLPNSIIFGAVSLDAVFTACALWPVHYCVKAQQRRSVRHAVGAGLLLGACSLFSFSAFPLGLLLLILLASQAVGSGAEPTRQVKTAAGICMGLAVFLGLASLAGFDLLATFARARNLEHGLMATVARDYSGRTLGELWLYTSWGNLLAFLIATGLPAVGLWWRGMIGADAAGGPGGLRLRGFAISLGICVLFMSAAGIYHMETERIWLFLSALVPVTIAGTLSGGGGGPAWRSPAMLVLGGCALQALATEVLFFTIW